MGLEFINHEVRKGSVLWKKRLALRSDHEGGVLWHRRDGSQDHVTLGEHQRLKGNQSFH